MINWQIAAESDDSITIRAMDVRVTPDDVLELQSLGLDPVRDEVMERLHGYEWARVHLKCRKSGKFVPPENWSRD